MSVIEEFGGGERVKSLFLLSENRLLTRGLPMDHGSGVYGSVGGKPEEEEEEEEEEEGDLQFWEMDTYEISHRCLKSG